MVIQPHSARRKGAHCAFKGAYMKLNLPIVLMTVIIACGTCGCEHNKSVPTQKEEAVKQWNQARAGVLASLANSQYEGGNLEKSQESVNEALRLTPDNAALHVMAGKIALEQGQLDR